MSYTLVKNHRGMVYDHRRNAAYASAIKKSVRPGDVVLDLGAGLGLLGLLAAHAGASRIYMVDPEPVIEAAAQAATCNTTNAEIVTLRGRIENVDIPEQVDVILSAFTGNFLFDEDLLPSLFWARDRYLKPNGIMLPDRARLHVAPVSMPKYHAEQISTWSDPSSGLDFSVGRFYAANSIFYPPRRVCALTDMLATPQEIIEIDFQTAVDASCSVQHAQFRAETRATMHGWLGWFSMRLCNDWYSTGPEARGTHWSLALLPLDPPLSIDEGNALELCLTRPMRGDWTWRTTVGSEQRRHSTFNSTPRPLTELVKQGGSHRVTLNEEGVATLFVLACFAERKLTNDEISHALLIQYPSRWRNFYESSALVKKLAANYS